MQRLDVVVPVFQNEATIESTFCGVAECLGILQGSEAISWRVLFVDDGSRDASWDTIRSLAEKEGEAVAGLRLVRNFGQVAAILAGMTYSDADAVVVMSADQQDPASIISGMLAEWREGWKVVVAEREAREDGLLRALTSGVFYRLLGRFGLPSLPRGGFDFFLVDRVVVDLLLTSGERHRFLQGDILWYGFEARKLPYVRRRREKGRSQWSLARRINYFIDGFVGYSSMPLRFASVFGIAAFLAAVLASIALVAQRVLTGTRAPGWTSIMILVLVLNGIQFVFLGILGEYLWRHLETSRRRPQFLVSQAVGLAGESGSEPGSAGKRGGGVSGKEIGWAGAPGAWRGGPAE